jgi:hypothetical protein
MKLAAWLSRAAFVLLAILLAGSVREASATLLAANGRLQPPSAQADTGGTIVATAAIPFINSTDVGTLTTTVEQNDPSNPFFNGTDSSVTGALTFIYTLANTGTIAAGDTPFTRVTFNGYGGWLVDASFISSAGDTEPGIITRARDGSTVGANYVSLGPSFPLTGPLNPGVSNSTSMEIVLHTNATTWTNTVNPIIGATINNAASFMPAPEPSSLALMLLGVGSLAIVRCRRRWRR